MSKLSYNDVLHADFTPLEETVGKWQNAPGKFEQVETNFNTEVVKGLVNSGFEGETAEAAWRKFRTVKAQLLAAQEESRRVHAVLSEALKVFRGAQNALKVIEDELKDPQNLHYLRLDKHGTLKLEFSDEEKADPETWSRIVNESLHIPAYKMRIERALKDADEADRNLAQALNSDVNDAARGFNDHAYDSLEEARKRTAGDLKEALHLAKTETGKMSSGQLKRLTALITRLSQDPQFAEEFATKLGAERTLKLWYNVTHPDYPDPDRKLDGWDIKSTEALQDALSTILATASHSHTSGMRQWKNKMIALGRKRLDSSGMDHPYGFQLMSNLMRTGTYDSGFLNRYGDRLVKWDKELNTRDGHAYSANNPLELHYLNMRGTDDPGRDAMVGFLEALGDNPARPPSSSASRTASMVPSTGTPNSYRLRVPHHGPQLGLRRRHQRRSARDAGPRGPGPRALRRHHRVRLGRPRASPASTRRCSSTAEPGVPPQPPTSWSRSCTSTAAPTVPSCCTNSPPSPRAWA